MIPAQCSLVGSCDGSQLEGIKVLAKGSRFRARRAEEEDGANGRQSIHPRPWRKGMLVHRNRQKPPARSWASVSVVVLNQKYSI